MNILLKILQSLKLKWIISFLIIVASLHLFTVLNKTYRYNDRNFNSDQYHLLIDKSNQYARYAIAFKAQVTYFYKYPDSLINVFYSCYLISIILLLVMLNKQGWGLFYFELPPPRPIRRDGESVSVFATRLLEWTNLIKERY